MVVFYLSEVSEECRIIIFWLSFLWIMPARTWRVGGVLAVSRSFGDRLLKQYVVADPEIREEKVDDTLEFLILARDGLWDVVTNQEAVSMTKPIQEPVEAAKQLMQESISERQR